MNIQEVVDGLIKEDKTGNGIRCLKLFKVENFDQIKEEVEQIISEKPATIIGDVSNKIGHYRDDDEILPYFPKVSNVVSGAWRTYRLTRNAPGWKEDEIYLDPSIDYSKVKFHYPIEFPNIAKYLSLFPKVIVSNLSGLLPFTQLVPHREAMARMFNGELIYPIRFHLPVIEDDRAYFWFNGKYYDFEPGYVYLFNPATVHSALNNSDKSRYNIIVDCFASEALNPLFESSTPALCVGEETLPMIEGNYKTNEIDNIDYSFYNIKLW